MNVSRVEQVLEKLGVAHKRQGNRVWAEECPLPSHGKPNAAHRFLNWMIRPDGDRAGLFYCYSCKGKGNLPELVMLLKGLDYRAAREWLRDFVDQEPADPYLRVRVGLDRNPGSVLLPEGVEMQGAPLEKWNSVARDYVVSRGLTDDQVRRWRIGYALFGRLDGRIFLPIYDSRGRLANYAARSFVGAEKRYLAAGTWESPDTSILFGQHRWPETGRNDVLLFEGALNGLALERALGESDVQLAGMSGLDQGSHGIEVRTLTNLATFRRVIVATDPDGPGDRAAAAIEAALGSRMPVIRLELPRGTDAAELSADVLAGILRAALVNSSARI